MISINRATAIDANTIVDIGLVSVEEAHRGSCSAEELNEYLQKHYNSEAIGAELGDEKNIYHVVKADGEPAGFSKIVLNAIHPDIEQTHVTKLDRIYLLSKFFNLRLGYELLQFNIGCAKANGQAGIWLYTWTGNTRAINFYQKNGFIVIGSHHFKVTETRYNLNHHMYLSFL
ncbi:MAG: GNAT family N-acetyltransferase [Ferruginibacter sp.]